MPTIFEYFGIRLVFFSNEHFPIHIHAFYNEEFGMRIEFKIENSIITEITYRTQKGYKNFPPKQRRDLTKLISAHQYEIVNDWINFVVLNNRVERKIITQRIK